VFIFSVFFLQRQENEHMIQWSVLSIIKMVIVWHSLPSNVCFFSYQQIHQFSNTSINSGTNC
jgi:hypothetical protein